MYRTECSYDADSDHRRKGALKRDIQSLQQQNDALDVIVASLRSLPEAESISLLHNLRGDTHPNALADQLRNDVRLPQNYAPQTLEADFAQQLTSPTSATFDTTSDFSRSISREGSGEDAQPAQTTVQPSSWFRDPPDPDFIEHLMHLYHSWIHPFHAFLSWDHFLHDMGRGKTDFCSAMLVNAMLAFACHYSDRAAARTDPANPETAGDYFFAEAKRLLDQADSSSLTTVQALGIMSLRETSAGRDSLGYRLAGQCVRMALELGLHLSLVENGVRTSEGEVRKVTFWAVFNLET